MKEPAHDLPSPYELLLMALALADLFGLMVLAVPGITAPVASLVGLGDLAVCAMFFADFVLRFWRAKDKRAFMKWGWIDLLASVPHVGWLRLGQVVRLVRILRVLRAVRSVRVIASHLWSYRGRHVLLVVASLAALVTLFAAVAVLQFEHVAAGNIHSPGDALWWAFTTVTTVGYGDRYPITWEGRVVAAGLMVVGVGLCGSFTAFAARLFLAPALRHENEELAQMRVELHALHEDMRALHDDLKRLRGQGVLAPKDSDQPMG